MKALVTGGNGYVGGHLVQKLVQKGYDVNVLDNNFNGKPWNHIPQITHIENTVLNPDAVRKSMQGVSIVYHLADRRDWSSNPYHIVRLFKNNVEGTVNVLNEARNAGVDNVIISSSYSVYGNVRGAEESGPFVPVNIYGHTKRAAEIAAMGFGILGLNVKILRLYTVWGGLYDSGVVSKFALNDYACLYENGQHTRDFVHISDVVQAFIDAYLWDEGSYNIGTGVEVNINSLWNMLRTEPATRCHEYRGAGVWNCFADMTKTYYSTAWRPQYVMGELSVDEIRELSKWRM